MLTGGEGQMVCSGWTLSGQHLYGDNNFTRRKRESVAVVSIITATRVRTSRILGPRAALSLLAVG